MWPYGVLSNGIAHICACVCVCVCVTTPLECVHGQGGRGAGREPLSRDRDRERVNRVGCRASHVKCMYTETDNGNGAQIRSKKTKIYYTAFTENTPTPRRERRAKRQHEKSRRLARTGRESTGSAAKLGCSVVSRDVKRIVFFRAWAGTAGAGGNGGLFVVLDTFTCQQ